MEIVGALAESDETHRDLELVADAEHHAALRGAIELGEDDAGELQRLLELAACVIAFWPVVASRTSNVSWGAPSIALAWCASPS